MSASDAVVADASNVEQLRAWDGDEGAYWADHAGHFDRSAVAYHRRLLEVASIERHDGVLDVGCGTGSTTMAAARAASSGSAFGVDLSSPMLDSARRRAAEAGIANIDFAQADAQIYRFEPGSYDVAISSMAAMFFADHLTAFRNIGRGLRPGGRLALATWQPYARNPWLQEISAALDAGRGRPAPPLDDGPFALSDPDRIRVLLTDAGYLHVEIDGQESGMWLGDDADDAHRFVLGLMGWVLDGLDQSARAGAIDALRDLMAAHETSDGVRLGSAVWIISAMHP